MVDFIPISATRVDWNTFLLASQRAIGRSPSASLDAAGLPVSGLAPFVAAVSEFSMKGSNPIKSMRGDSFAQVHLTFTFMVNLDRQYFFELAQYNLFVSPAYGVDVALVSGNLRQWSRATSSALQTGVALEVRELFTLLLAWFERNDFGEVWSSYEKRMQGGALVLVPKGS